MKTGININVDQIPNLAKPKTVVETNVITQLMNLKMVKITINGTFPILIKSKHLAKNEGSESA